MAGARERFDSIASGRTLAPVNSFEARIGSTRVHRCANKKQIRVVNATAALQRCLGSSVEVALDSA
jgi:hypothetical protein